MKRVFDLLLILIASPLLLLILGFVTVSVKLKLGSPIIFKQSRPGLKGKPFLMIKFRTMTTKKDSTGNLLSDEERLTSFGKLLRATSLDELPELWNVLKGEMSLVGPRPLLPEYLPLYSAEQSRRHDVRPGITGWAQINGRNAISWEEKFELDVWYVDNHALWLDIKILFLTIKKVVIRDGISSEGHVTISPFSGSL